MDEEYLISTIRYVELNPVTAGLCVNPEDGKWSSASAHINGVDDTLVSVRPMLNRIDDWAGYLSMNEFGTNAEAEIEKHTRTGRPLGEQPFISELELITGRSLMPVKPGPKPKMM